MERIARNFDAMISNRKINESHISDKQNLGKKFTKKTNGNENNLKKGTYKKK